MQQSALSMYKQVELNNLTSSQITVKLLDTVLLDIKDFNESDSNVDKVKYISNALQIVYLILEHLNSYLPTEELDSYINILLKVGDYLKNSLKTKKPVNSGVIDTLSYLVELNRTSYKEKRPC